MGGPDQISPAGGEDTALPAGRLFRLLWLRLERPRPWPVGLGCFTSVFLLACGAASLNSYQEHRWDRLMRRTRRRPVALGIITPEQARRQGQVLAGLGLFLLYLGTSDPAPVLVGSASLVIYNLVYTPLKYRSVWALLPGAVCGALPSYIGWLAGGGAIFSPIVIGAAALLALWQIPHFWLVMLYNKSDYRSSSLPSLVNKVPERSLRLISVIWFAALIVVLHTLLAFFTSMPATIRIMISLVSLVVLLIYGLHMGAKREPPYRFLFIMLNSFMLYTMALLSVGAVVS
ncbi:MAG: UbiA family prenyltransferase [Desulfofustis sp.]